VFPRARARCRFVNPRNDELQVVLKARPRAAGRLE
jgi:hypothetical protein